MTTSLTSTVPGAIGLLKTYLDQVAATNEALDVGTYVGVPIAEVTNNYMMVGNWETGQLVEGYHQEFASLPATANRKSEEYHILGTVRTWNGDSDPVTRLTEAFALINGVMTLMANDPNASGTISASGTWEVDEVSMPSSGPFGGKGWGVLLEFTVRVFNVRLTS